ncbi:TPA: hypothetical protein ACIAR9_004595, partial [Salmonella enterica subsp. enterica serovar Poona]
QCNIYVSETSTIPVKIEYVLPMNRQFRVVKNMYPDVPWYEPDTWVTAKTGTGEEARYVLD